MPAHQAGAPRVSSTVTKHNPRPRKYASAAERQAAYRARAPEVCFRAEAKTVETLDRIADTIDQSRADLLLSMTKFALANHDWARFGLTHRPLPFGYGVSENSDEARGENPAPIWKRKRPKSLGKPVPLTPKQKAAAKAMADAAGRPYPNLVDNIAASRLENPTMKADKWKRDKLRGTYTRGGYVIYKIGLPTSLNRGWYVESPDGQMIAAPDYLEEAKRIVDQAIEGVDIRKVNPMKKPTPAQLAARAKFAEMARSGAFKKKAKRNPAKKTVSQKISQLTREGYPQKQAVAIALEEQRRGKVKANPARRGRAPSIMVGDYVRSYDFPGMHDDHYLEGVVTAIGNGVYSISVSRRVVGGEEKSIPPALRQVRAPIEPHFMTGVYGVQKITRKSNPATGLKKSRTKLNPAGAKLYTVSRADANGNPVYHLAHFRKMADAKAYAQAYADANKTRVTITSKSL